MQTKGLYLLFVSVVVSLVSYAQDHILKDSKSWVVPTTFENDPIGVKMYQLNNGLTIMLSEDHNQSNIMGAVVVKAGGKNRSKKCNWKWLTILNTCCSRETKLWAPQITNLKATFG